jgi:type I restriction enzyme S subunit
MEGRAPEGMDEATAALFPDALEESELGWVPKGWRVGTLADLAEFQNGYAFKSKDWVDSGHPVVKIGDVKPGIIDFSGCSFVTAKTTSGLDRFRLNRGDLLVGMTGYVGETGLVAEVEPAAYMNQRVGRIATANGMEDGGFVYCLARNTEFKAYAVAQSHGSAQANVSGSALLNYSSVIPTADLLSKFNDLIFPILETILANHETAQTLATLRDTLLPRLISGQLRLPEAQAEMEESL